ncbi:MFS transporter [Verrucomicrobia bacterium IMCC26134]|nr:MFS transporter [Verrucomicrobia bacterium IMCC26134]
MSTHATPLSPSATKRPLSLGVIFLTLYIDLIGFSIVFPLGPDLLHYYLDIDGTKGLLGALLGQINSLAAALGNTSHLPEVLFGGIISSVFSVLQFIFSPFWGGLSDRIGRRPVLLYTVAGTALSYLLWALSGSFWLFLLARILGGLFGGNLSVATAAVADVTSRAERSKAMGLVGAAFGLGLVTGPVVGALSAKFNLLESWPCLAGWGVNPFSVPALVAFLLSLLNLVWIRSRFRETLPPATSGRSAEPRLRNPLSAILGLDNAAVRGANLVGFLYQLAFVAMETSLVFLSAERFHYGPMDNGKLMGFLGVCSIITQGYIVRKLVGRVRETRLLAIGLVCSTAGLLGLGFAPTPGVLYAAVAALAFGGGLINPSNTGLISLYASPEEQGRVLGIYRSLGSLARAVTPICAGVLYWTAGSRTLYVVAAALAVAACAATFRLPQPKR